MTLAESLTEEALILRLRTTEHDFVERKSRSDKGGWLQTAVAFANSAHVGWPALLFVGVDDGGTPQQGADKLEDLTKAVSSVLDKAYPTIQRHIVPLHLQGGACLAIVIPGSDIRPHFAGKPYVRVGSETKSPSEEQFSLLIAERKNVVRELVKWRGKLVTFEQRDDRSSIRLRRSEQKLIDCSQFFVTLAEPRRQILGQETHTSIPIRRIELSYDHESNRLIVIDLEAVN